jgi:hypothetical protein
MLGVKLTILRYVGDDPQPGVVEGELEDAHGRRLRFRKTSPTVLAVARVAYSAVRYRPSPQALFQASSVSVPETSLFYGRVP